jgi:trimethylamine:corrinoid methyltransferase-like protein
MELYGLSPEKRELVKKKAFELLELRGVRVDHPQIPQRMATAGAQVDHDTQQVRFPRQLLEELLDQAPRELVLHGREGCEPLRLPRERGHFLGRSNTGAQSWIEPGTGEYRRITLQDVANWGRLVSSLPNIDFCAFPAPVDAPSAAADLYSLKTILEYTSKHVWIQPYTRGSVESLIELAAVAAGGEEELRSHPPVSFVVCSFTPLAFKSVDLEAILRCAKLGIPMQLCSLPSAGATAPITAPGGALTAIVEILAMMAISQIIEPGAPIIPTPIIFSMDMRSGRTLQSSSTALRACSLAVQFFKEEFGFPVHTYGAGSDSPTVGGQSTNEGALTGLTMALSGADILGGAGQLETARTISPQQLVIDNELFGQLRRMVSDVSIDDETLAWQDLLDVTPCDHFLRTRHTRRHARNSELVQVLARTGRERWEHDGSRDLFARAESVYREAIAGEMIPVLTKEQVQEMESILKWADSRLGR